MQVLLNTIKGIVFLLWIALGTLLLSVFILVMYLLSFLMPKGMRHKIIQFLSFSPVHWNFINGPALRWLGASQWAVDFPKNLDPKGIYLVIANHQSWTDILILSYVLNKKVAPLKFFMKKELKWQLPVIGLACKAIGFPMLSRHTKAQIKKNPSLKNKDRESTVQACEFVKRHPASLIIFPEGSRFTKQKHARQNSPFQNLLKPKAGGAAMTINGVDDGLQGILDLTVDYHIGHNKISFWDFLQGKYKSIKIYATLLPLTADLKGNYEDDKDYRKHIQSWLTQRWQLKDKVLSGGDAGE